MESPPQNKAASMDGIKKPHLLPVTLPQKTPRLDVVQRVSAWALFNASVFAFSFGVAFALDHFRVRSGQPAMLCCVALQAAAAVLALCLPCTRRWVRRALAYLALALTTVGHCFAAAVACLLLVADPGDLFLGISSAVGIFVFASGDITSFLDLLLGREE